MSADLSTGNWIAENLALALETAPALPAAKKVPGVLQLGVTAAVEDVLALLRTAVILARHFGASLIVDLPEVIPGRTHLANSVMEVHLGAAPCSAMVSALLRSVEHRLRKLNSDLNNSFFVEFGFAVDSRGFLLRIRDSKPAHQARSQHQEIAAETPAVPESSPAK